MTFQRLAVLGVRSNTIIRVYLPDGRVERLYDKTEPAPDGIIVEDGVAYWTTMGKPTRDRSKTGEASLDYSARNGGVHAIGVDGSNRRELVEPGAITTGKQIASDGRGHLYWGDREGCRVSRVGTDGTGLCDLIINTDTDDPSSQCVGVAVDPQAGYLYWTQKGPAKGGVGMILRAGLELPPGETPDRRSDIEVLWDSLPEPIDLEIVDDWLYWTDRGAGPKGNTINRARIPASGAKGADPEILADGFKEAIGLAVDTDARVVYVSDLSGRIWAVALDGSTGSRTAQVVADVGEALTGIAGIHGLPQG